MAKTFKGFVPSETVTFELESPDGARKVTFRCKPSVPGSKFLQFMASADSKLGGEIVWEATRPIVW